MAKTTYKVGDKVRILDANAIMACEAKDGDILEVIDVEASVLPTLRDVDGEGLCILGSELKYIEKVAEQVAKFKVGDKFKLLSGGGAFPLRGATNGKVYEIAEIRTSGRPAEYRFINDNRHNAYANANQIELATPKPTKNQRITTLEQTVATLQAEVEALKATQKIAVSSPTMTVKADVDVAKIAESLAKAIGKQTPNEQRKAIIDEAKAFLVEVEREQNDSKVRGKGNVFHRQYLTKTEFIVNTEKRTVVAIIRTKYGTTLLTKGIAKCAPGDVFNADIGKAIALGRALGLDVNKFEKAVQPSEVVVGMSVKNTGSAGGTYSITYVEDGELFIRDNGGTGPYFEDKYAVILDDSEAQY